MDIVKIDGKRYFVKILEIEENFNILYSDNTGRTVAIGAPMSLDPLGTFYGHEITFDCKPGYEKEYDDLFEYLSKPRYSGISIECVHGQKTISYNAYVSSGKRTVKKINEKNEKVYWGKFSANFVAMEAQVTA